MQEISDDQRIKGMTAGDEEWKKQPVGVLASGGLDSAILVGDLARTSPRVQPMYVRFGLVWEETEEAGLRNFLSALKSSRVAPLKVFECPIREVYGDHWSTSGQATPDANSQDEAVFLPGRNLLLFSQTAIWCHLQGIGTIASGVLAGNPFADATDEYFESIERSVNLALTGKLRFVRPYRSLSKIDVLKRGVGLPLGETMSCIHPLQGRHCGCCNKCEERRKGFLTAGMADPTTYAGEVDS